jgi:prepilin-type processing-associated H-X9-DG protein
VHGDLSGNVLFADGRPPAIIDFSPYWRPAAYADAIVAVDGLLWFDADPELLRLADSSQDFPQLLVRAQIFRLVALNEGARGEGADLRDQLARFDGVASSVEALLH